MKKLIPFAVILAVMFMACSISVDITPPPPTSIFTVAAPPVTEAPIVSAPTPAPVNVTCNGVSLYIDPALGSSYSCQTIPESAEDMAIHPQYTEITFHGYPLANTFFTPRIDIFPVQRFSEMAPDFIPGRVQMLQNLIAGGMPGDSDLPLLPIFNAAQVFTARYGVVGFQNGSGIRYLTLYAQYAAPINNHDLFYTFQGLTSDGQYWVSVILPISNPILPADGVNPPGGQSWEDFSNNYQAYAADMTVQLNAQPPDSFAPAITLLDALINSIIIQP
ncbi:MAG: hypothetical protein FD146_1409 [Anaerolineaceae bacterium]|nr:MAG: hypothetical protein FD146_1409 [Anaerolineaceae bacterium]